MSRKGKAAPRENHERWLVSYADFITLLFAFFVVMFASSQADKARASQVSESVKRALEESRVAAALAGMLGGSTRRNGKGNEVVRAQKAEPAAAARQELLVELLPALDYLTSELKNEIAAGKLQVKLEARGLVVSLTEAAFFPSGEDTIAPGAYGSIEKIAAVIKSLPNPVRLEGHTDSVPIHNSRFRSNWELSAARSIAMLSLLTSRFAVPEPRVAVAGYAANAPLETNLTEAGRAHNRRVDIVILNKLGYDSEPTAETQRRGEN